MAERLDFLAIGAHPDDVEIGMGGTLAKYAHLGYKTGILNLTKAELSSNGSVEERQLEAEKAAEILHVATRIQFDFPDRHIIDHRAQCIESVVKVIRKYRPKVVFAPHKEDRHPDHGHCSEVVKEAVFSSGIRKYLEHCEDNAFRPDALYYYQINGFMNPHVVVDITEFMSTKLDSLACFKSQFELSHHHVNTPLNSGYLEQLKGRENVIGKEVGVTYGEGFRSEKPILINVLGE